MSHSMSPPYKPAPQPAQRPYSPYQSAGSPTNQYGPPPAKRQRMSPGPGSPPNGLPNHYPPQPQHGVPQQHMGQYGNPYTQSSVQSPYSPSAHGASPQSSFNTPQAYPFQHLPWQQQQSQSPVQPTAPQRARETSPPSQQSREMMPPPPRPLVKEEKEEKLDLSDSLYGSGINLKDEENYHHAVYSNRHTQSDSFFTTQDGSFGSNTMSPNNSFNMLTQGTFSSSQDASGPLAGTMGQTQSQEDIEAEARKKRERAAIAKAERQQHHLNNQFLQCNTVRKRMDTLAREQGVRLSVMGLLIRQEETAVMTNGAGTQGIAASGVGGPAKPVDRPESMVQAGSPYEQLVSLISLAAGERLRGLLDESFALARARRYGDHGRVPPEFADIADVEGHQNTEEVVPQNITGTEWDKAKLTTPQRTISSDSKQNSLASTLLAIAARDKAAEEARIKKREARRRAAANAASTDTPAEEAMPEVALEVPKMTKKEQIKQAKGNKSTEAALHQTTNQTAAMMTLGKKGKQKWWMTGGAAAMPTNRFAKPTPSASASGTATPVKKEADASGSIAGAVAEAAKAVEVKAPEWGDWHEDGQEGKGIQVRDWVLVLERDGREKKALQRCYNRMGHSDESVRG